MMDDLNINAVLTITQALQLVGLVPCVFVVFFLLTLVPRNRQAIVPAFYFASLACAFALPLAELFLPLAENPALHAVLLFAESLLIAFSFLLILQFMTGRTPAVPYWFVLAVPLVGGASLIYAGVIAGGASCAPDAADCYDVDSIKTLYTIVSSSLIFLLLMYYSAFARGVSADDEHRRHKYWLIVALILLNLFVLAVDLAKVAGRLQPGQADFIITVLRLAFIYLVITSLFRVFYPTLARQIIYPVSRAGANNPALDQPLVDKIRALLEEECAYREMRLNRAALARLAGTQEHNLSRIINRYFGKSFNELINGYRIEEAKRRLKSEPDQQITVIGFEAGFNSIASFNRVFKDMVGVSPTEWRGKS